MRPSEIKAAVDHYGIVPTKRKGQHFLLDEGVAQREVEALDPSSRETVLEVGPGLGMLTDLLLKRAGRVLGIELDERILSYLTERYGEQIVLIRGNALKVPFPEFDHFISNMPYGISSPLVFKLLEHRFGRGVIMVQREFADRMIAAPGTGDYSRLSVKTYYMAECKMIEAVSRSKFWPEPDVDSAVLLLRPRRPPFHVKDQEFFLKLVDMLFQNRRKKIGTILRNRKIVPKDGLASLPFVDDRVEVLSPEDIGELSDAIISL